MLQNKYVKNDLLLSANIKLLDNLIVSPDTSTLSMARSADWLEYWLASGLKQPLIVCVLSVTEGLVSDVATRTLSRTYKFRTANETVPPLRILVSRDPWHPFTEPSLRNAALSQSVKTMPSFEWQNMQHSYCTDTVNWGKAAETRGWPLYPF
jgi:hypothetical protein